MKTPEEKYEEKLKKNYAKLLKSQMTPNQKIDMLNTPYKDLPEPLKAGMTKNPQVFNFVRFAKPNIGRQQERFGARLIKYRTANHVNPKQFCDICNMYATQFDVPSEKGRGCQRTRITLRDLESYEENNVCPKIDKMMIISAVTGLPIDYFAGYGPDSRRMPSKILKFPTSPEPNGSKNII